MAEIARKPAANTPRQFPLLLSLQRVLATWLKFLTNLPFVASKCQVTIRQQWKLKFFKMEERLDGCSGKTLLVPCARRKNLQRKIPQTTTG